MSCGLVDSERYIGSLMSCGLVDSERYIGSLMPCGLVASVLLLLVLRIGAGS